MKLFLALLLTLTYVSADLLTDYETLSSAISSSRQRRSLEDHKLVKQVLDLLHKVEESGSKRAKQAKEELMNIMGRMNDKLREWGEAASSLGKRDAGTVTEAENNQKMMDKVLLLVKLKFDQYKQKLSTAFDKLAAEMKPIGLKYKAYGENIAMVAVDGLKKFAKHNVDIFNQFQEKVKANLNGILDDGKQFFVLVKDKAIKPFGK